MHIDETTSKRISKHDKHVVLDVIWDLRRRLQLLDDTHTADKILHGVYLAEREIENIPVETKEVKIHA